MRKRQESRQLNEKNKNGIIGDNYYYIIIIKLGRTSGVVGETTKRKKKK